MNKNKLWQKGKKDEGNKQQAANIEKLDGSFTEAGGSAIVLGFGEALPRLARPRSDYREELQILVDMGFSEDHALNALCLSDGTIGGAFDSMQHFKESILISGDGKSEGRGEDLRFVSPLKQAWVEVPTDIEPPLNPQNVVDRDDAQHKESKKLGKSFPTSGDNVVVPSVASEDTSETLHKC